MDLWLKSIRDDVNQGPVHSHSLLGSISSYPIQAASGNNVSQQKSFIVAHCYKGLTGHFKIPDNFGDSVVLLQGGFWHVLIFASIDGFFYFFQP